jgi:plastocyanin
MSKTNALIGLIVLIGIGGLIMFPKIKSNIDEDSNRPKIAGPQSPPPSSNTIQEKIPTETVKTPEAEIIKKVSPIIRTIIFNSTSYSPSILSISSGEKVTFKNESDKNMWPASDPHPAHTNFSDFDSKGVIAPGGIYEFVFEKTGTYTYHDHRTPSIKGIIIVN